VDATADGLSELGAHEPEAIFREAFALVKPEWDYIGSLASIDFDSFVTWYSDSALSRDLQPLNRRFWAHLDQFEDLGLYYYWVQYARHNPDLLKDDFSETG
jgi:hypothetical protein